MWNHLATIMIPLLNEGVEVSRPVQAEQLPGGRYRIVSENSNPEDEQWGFTTGQLVLCEVRSLEGKKEVVAVSLAGDAA